MALDITTILHQNWYSTGFPYEIVVKAIFENNVLKPLDKLDLLEGEEVEIELKKKSIFGLLKGWKIDTQSRKDELKSDRWLDYYCKAL